MIEPSILESRLREALEDIEVLQVEDLTGTRDHYQVTVVSPVFRGKSRIEQHQLVYRALGELMHGPVHALALQTFAPETWASRPSK
jgi:stress-induced morphogen